MATAKKYNILYIDDEVSNLKTFKAVFKWDYNVFTAESGLMGEEILKEQIVALIIADQRMPGMTGFEFFKKIIPIYPDPIRIILTGYTDMEVLIKAINECGIYQYLTKPWNEQEVRHVLDGALEIYRLRRDNNQLIQDLKQANQRLLDENYYLKEEIKLEHNFENMIGASKKFKEVLFKIEQVAVTDATVLVQGESGTGKELLARAIHRISQRKDQPLMKINCAALPSELIESELFGHEKGAFTGAINGRKGRFELAHKGTIFLDEIGELPLELQSKLLRVIQEGEFERLGSENTIKVDVRIIAATNRNLEEAIKKNQFREDLYYRLNVFPIYAPSLRQREEDIPILVNHFLKKYEGPLGHTINKVPKAVMQRLTKYNWPGNIRELENIIQRSIITSTSNILKIGPWFEKQSDPLKETPLALTELERSHIIKVLKSTNWRVSGKKGAAEKLQINPKTLYSRLEKLGIKRPSSSDISE